MLSIIILAAGKGTRMKSDLPKVLQPMAGKALLKHVVDSARKLEPNKIIVVHGFGGDRVKADFESHNDIDWVHQKEQLGTGHAVKQASKIISADDEILILYGDVPLISTTTLKQLLSGNLKKGINLLSAILPDPSGYGRIVRKKGNIQAIIEDSDASEEIKKIKEINTGIMACNGNLLKKLLSRLKNDNIKKEYYLTDIIDMAVTDGLPVNGFKASTWEESMGINDKIELARAERLFQKKLAKELMQNGVTIMDPARIDIRGDIKCGSDVLIDVNTVFEGKVNLGNNVKIGPNTYICDAKIGDNSVIHANSHILGAEIGTNAQIGPFARLRPGAELQNNVKVGNFVEIKKSSIGSSSKVNHLSYIGDSEIGNHVNIGAGTITCNYDGANKHKTQIDDGAFIGSGVELVAPVKIGKDATIGAGSTISRDVEDEKLSVERADQKMINDWKRPKKS